MLNNTEQITIPQLLKLIEMLEAALEEFPQHELAPEWREALREFRSVAINVLEF